MSLLFLKILQIVFENVFKGFGVTESLAEMLQKEEFFSKNSFHKNTQKRKTIFKKHFFGLRIKGFSSFRNHFQLLFFSLASFDLAELVPVERVALVETYEGKIVEVSWAVR